MHSGDFRVISYSENGTPRKPVEAANAHEAYSLAYGNPTVVCEKLDLDGFAVDTCYFSPKHPLWSRDDFVKWANANGSVKSRQIRQRNNQK